MAHFSEEAEQHVERDRRIGGASAGGEHGVVRGGGGRDAGGLHLVEQLAGLLVQRVARVGGDEGGVGERGARLGGEGMEYLEALVEQGGALAPEHADDDGVDVLVGAAPRLALHVLEQPERPLPVAAAGELAVHRGEVLQREPVARRLEAPRDGPPRRQVAQPVDQRLHLVRVPPILHHHRRRRRLPRRPRGHHRDPPPALAASPLPASPPPRGREQQVAVVVGRRRDCGGGGDERHGSIHHPPPPTTTTRRKRRGLGFHSLRVVDFGERFFVAGVDRVGLREARVRRERVGLELAKPDQLGPSTSLSISLSSLFPQ